MNERLPWDHPMDPRNALHPDRVEREKRWHIPYRRYASAEDALRAVAYAVYADSDIWNHGMSGAIGLMRMHFKAHDLCVLCGWPPSDNTRPGTGCSDVNMQPYKCEGCERMRWPYPPHKCGRDTCGSCHPDEVMTKVADALAQMEGMLAKPKFEYVPNEWDRTMKQSPGNTLHEWLVMTVGSAQAETFRAIINNAVLAEREACAKIAEERAQWARQMYDSNYRAAMADHIAAAIRARGKE